MPQYLRVAGTDDVAIGTGIVATVNGKEYAVFNVGDSFYVIDNVCLHKGGPLGEGDLEEEIVTCPWHGWEYDVKTGNCLTKEGARIGTYLAKVEDGNIMIELPDEPVP